MIDQTKYPTVSAILAHDISDEELDHMVDFMKGDNFISLKQNFDGNFIPANQEAETVMKAFSIPIPMPEDQYDKWLGIVSQKGFGFETEDPEEINAAIVLATPEMKSLKKNKVKMSDEERDQAMRAGAVWHHGPAGEETCGIQKATIKGKDWYWCATHRAYQAKPTLKGAIKAFEFIKTTSSVLDEVLSAVPEWPAELKDEYAIADYIEQTASDDVDREMIEELLKGCHAVLKELPVSAIWPSRQDVNVPNKSREKIYLRQDPKTMPPIVVDSDFVIIDGNHRRRVAEQLGLENMLAYVVEGFVWDR